MGLEDAFKKVGIAKSEKPHGTDAGVRGVDPDLHTSSLSRETPGRPRRTVQQAWKAVQDAPPGTVWHADDRDIRIIEAVERNSKKQKEKE